MSRRLLTGRVWTPALPGLLALFAGCACAQETVPYYLSLSQSFSHDSNLLRLGDFQDTPVGFSRSESISATSLTAGIDQTFGRQRLFGSASARNNRYSKNTRYNNTGYSASLGLDWSTVERISGNLSGSASRSLQSFGADLFTTDRSKNLETSKSLGGKVSIGLITQYSAELGFGRRDVKNSSDSRALQSREFEQDNASLGLRWRPSAITTFGVAVSGSQGRYPKFSLASDGSFVGDRYKRQDIDFTATYRPTGASSVEGRLSQGKTTYDLNSRRDFSGLTGYIYWTWQATGKLSLNTGYSRDTGQDSYATTSPFNTPATADYSRINTAGRLQLSYAATAKLSAVLGLTYTQRDLVRTIDDPFIPQNAFGNDKTNQVSLGGRWTPTRTSLIGCDFSNERRKGSGALTQDMKSNSAACYGQITLQ